MTGRAAASAAEPESVRLDVWLWAARFYKTRSLARQAVATGKVDIGGVRAAKPARAVKMGDVMSVRRGAEVFEIVVAGLSDARGAASLAQALYREGEASRLRREQLHAEQIAARTGYRAPGHRPDKRARRLIRALGDIDAM